MKNLKTTSTILSLAVASVLFVGCDSKEETPMPKADGTPAKTDMMDKAVDNAKSTMGGANTDMTKVADAAKDNALKATDAAKDTADKTAADTSKMADATSAEAKKLLDQAMDYIKANKYELADSTLTKVESMRGSLSPEMQSALDNAKKALDTAKKAMGAMPAMPK